MCPPCINTSEVKFSVSKDKILFGKNIYGKAEYSKTWATKNIEQLSDVRLNNNHIAIKLAMVF